MEIEKGVARSYTEVIDQFEKATETLLGFIRNAKNRIDVCVSWQWPSVVVSFEPYLKEYINAHERGAKIRIVTEINGANIRYCKEVMKFAELRHADGIKGNFGVTEAEYVAAGTLAEATPAIEIIYSNSKPMIDQQSYIFETIWSKAVPAQQRISEIEEGIEPEFIEIITEGEKAAGLIVDFARSVRKEAQLILPQPKTIERAGKLGMWDMLVDAANRYGAEIRVISPITDANSDLAQDIMKKAPTIRILAGPVSPAGLFIQDEKRYFRAEDKDPDAAQAADAISRVIYSNSRNGVSSFKSFFETLWKQSSLSEELRLANEKLVLQDRLQKEFINIAAHELRTPVQPILGLAELKEADFVEGRNEISLTKDEMAIIVRNAKRLARLSSDILQVSRIESGSLQLDIQEFNLDDVIIPIVGDVQGQISNRGRKDIKITYTPGHENRKLKGDKEKLAEVVWNLMDNAVKFTKSGAISVGTELDSSDSIVVTVKDTGTGIDSVVMPRLFDKFVTKSESGTGLGLYISKNIVEVHGGKIWAENNNDGNGASFSFAIPVNAPENGTASSAQKSITT